MASDYPRTITLYQPQTLVFGAGCLSDCATALAQRDDVFFVITSTPTRSLGEPLYKALRDAGRVVEVFDQVNSEPTIAMFEQALSAARNAKATSIVGLGGGSPLDVAKLVAALLDGKQQIREVFGIGKLLSRAAHLVCIPTTAGTGSEVSPNAILLDESENLKKGAVSPHLVPDAAYVDPALTLSVPPAVTGATGIDALTHCIEAYVNKLAHPVIDLVALEGIRLIAGSIEQAYKNGQDLEARTNVMLGSMYGGLCLGPVNTGAVHALSYPLGGEFHIAHGVANSVLLPHVLEFNLPAALDRYAKVALAMGVDTSPVTVAAAPIGHVGVPASRKPTTEEIARRGLQKIRNLSKSCGIPQSLTELKVPQDAIDRLAKGAMTVTRLLDRNIRTVTYDDAVAIYRKAF